MYLTLLSISLYPLKLITTIEDPSQLIGNATINNIVNRLHEIHVEPAPIGIVHCVLCDEAHATGWNVTHQRADRERLRALRLQLEGFAALDRLAVKEDSLRGCLL